MNRKILRLAVPNIISNITIPVVGLVDIAIAGNTGGDTAIGAVALGATIFGFIYWNCAFLRMGTSGLTAQAYGARDFKEIASLLVRSVAVSLVIAFSLLLFQLPVGRLSISVMNPEPEVGELLRAYFFARVWAAPATVSLYAIHGWFIGMQNAQSPMWVSLFINGMNITFSMLFAYTFGMGVLGVAWGTVVAQYSGALLSWILWFRYYRRFARYIDWGEALRLKPMLRFFDVNKDIFLRTAFNVMVYTFFTWASARFGLTVLATNTILMNLFTLFSYMLDGFAYAAEAITGRYTGSGNFEGLRLAVRRMFWWCFGAAALSMAAYGLFWVEILGLFNPSQDVIACAGEYIGWVMLVPLVGFAPFLMDGILIGATRTRILRNSMFVATAVFFTLYYSLAGVIGNDALWLSFIIFIICRGGAQYFMSDRLKVLYRK